MAVLFADNFNRANGALGANWTHLAAAPSISSNQCALNSSLVFSHWNGGTPPADCYVKCVVAIAANGFSLYLRFNLGTGDGYQLLVDFGAGNARVYRLDATSPTQLGATFDLPSVSETVEFRIVGSTITVYYDDALVATRSDGNHTAAGVAVLGGQGTTVRIDDFEIGSVGDAPTIDTHPSNDTVTEGEAGEFTAAATGEDSVQWQFNDGGGWEDVDHGSGDETDTYSTGTTTLAMDGWQYRAAYTNDHGTTYTNAATLTVETEPTAGALLPILLAHYG